MMKHLEKFIDHYKNIVDPVIDEKAVINADWKCLTSPTTVVSNMNTSMCTTPLCKILDKLKNNDINILDVDALSIYVVYHLFKTNGILLQVDQYTTLADVLKNTLAVDNWFITCLCDGDVVATIYDDLYMPEGKFLEFAYHYAPMMSTTVDDLKESVRKALSKCNLLVKEPDVDVSDMPIYNLVTAICKHDISAADDHMLTLYTLWRLYCEESLLVVKPNYGDNLTYITENCDVSRDGRIAVKCVTTRSITQGPNEDFMCKPE